jgi:FK506-binding nuclear protein
MVLDQPLNQPPFDDDSDEDLDDEDAYDLREVSSDVEMNPEDIDGLESDAR